MLDDAWMKDAACKDADEKLFFPKKGSGGNYPYNAGKRICVACPVRKDCLMYAIAHSIPHGLWGGVSPARRRDIPIRLKREIRHLWFRMHPRKPMSRTLGKIA